MSTTPQTTDGNTSDSARERAEHHAAEAERLLKSWWLSSHVQAQVHATLAVYYSEQVRTSGGG